MLKRYIGDKAFSRRAIATALPILLQNLITNLVSLLDNVMVGQLDTAQIGAVTIVNNNLLYILNICLFGGSAGREGAALQIGGSSASLLAKLLRLKDKDTTVLVMSGMSAVFAGLFATPLTACLFTMEFASVGTIFSPALLPCFLSAFTARKHAPPPAKAWCHPPQRGRLPAGLSGMSATCAPAATGDFFGK